MLKNEVSRSLIRFRQKAYQFFNDRYWRKAVIGEVLCDPQEVTIKA
jgi:hypothetical protein